MLIKKENGTTTIDGQGAAIKAPLVVEGIDHTIIKGFTIITKKGEKA